MTRRLALSLVLLLAAATGACVKRFALDDLTTEDEVRAYVTRKAPPQASWVQVKTSLADEGLEFGEAATTPYAIFRSKSFQLPFSVRRDWRIDFGFEDSKLKEVRVEERLTGP